MRIHLLALCLTTGCALSSPPPADHQNACDVYLDLARRCIERGTFRDDPWALEEIQRAIATLPNGTPIQFESSDPNALTADDACKARISELPAECR